MFQTIGGDRMIGPLGVVVSLLRPTSRIEERGPHHHVEAARRWRRKSSLRHYTRRLKFRVLFDVFIKFFRFQKCIAVVWLFTFCVGFIPVLFWFGSVSRDRTQLTAQSQWPSCSLYESRYEQLNYFAIKMFDIILMT